RQRPQDGTADRADKAGHPEVVKAFRRARVLSRSQPYRSERQGVIARLSAAADPKSIVPLAQEPACLGYCAGLGPNRGYTKIPTKAAIGRGWKCSHILYAQFWGG